MHARNHNALHARPNRLGSVLLASATKGRYCCTSVKEVSECARSVRPESRKHHANCTRGSRADRVLVASINQAHQRGATGCLHSRVCKMQAQRCDHHFKSTRSGSSRFGSRIPSDHAFQRVTASRLCVSALGLRTHLGDDASEILALTRLCQTVGCLHGRRRHLSCCSA
jgi:hypothetical protein